MYHPRGLTSLPAKAPVALETKGIPLVSSSIRIGDPVAVDSMTCRSALRSAHVFALRRSFLSRLYISEAARFRVSKSGSSISSEGARASTRTAVATSSGSRCTTAAGSSSFSVSLTAQGYAGSSLRPQSTVPARPGDRVCRRAGDRPSHREGGGDGREPDGIRDRGGWPRPGHVQRVVTLSVTRREVERSVRAGRLDRERHGDVLAGAAPDHRERGLVAGRHLADLGDEGRRGVDALTVDGDDDVAVLDAGVRGGRPAVDGYDLGAGTLGAAVGDHRVAGADPEERVLGLAALDELVGDRLGLLDGDGEADADVAALAAARALAQRRDRAVDADELALGVDERATGVARVDRGRRLDGVRHDLVAGRLLLTEGWGAYTMPVVTVPDTVVALPTSIAVSPTVRAALSPRVIGVRSLGP